VPRHSWDPVAAPPRGLVRPLRVGEPGGPTRGRAGDPLAWRRTSRGRYVPAYVDGSVPEQRILEQSARLPLGGAVTGWAGCRLHGAAFFDGLMRDGATLLPVPLAVGPGGKVRGDGAVLLSYHPLPAEEVVERHGVPTATPPRCVVDHARVQRDRREVVVAVDMMAAARLLQTEELTAYAGGLRTGERRLVRWACALASPHSRSPHETRLRLVAELDAGLPPLWVNAVVLDRTGRRLGEVDLLDIEAGMVIEYDGADHRTAGQHTHHVGKEAALRRVGLEVSRVIGADLRHPGRVAERLLEVRSRARFEAEAWRAWTARPRDPALRR
jgi:hypothetical protein